MLCICAIPAALLTPLMLIPSYYQNIESFISIMRYWWLGSRFDASKEPEEEEEKGSGKKAEPNTSIEKDSVIDDVLMTSVFERIISREKVL
jgi:hypothetical protein